MMNEDVDNMVKEQSIEASPVDVSVELEMVEKSGAIPQETEENTQLGKDNGVEAHDSKVPDDKVIVDEAGSNPRSRS